MKIGDKPRKTEPDGDETNGIFKRGWDYLKMQYLIPYHALRCSLMLI